MEEDDRRYSEHKENEKDERMIYPQLDWIWTCMDVEQNINEGDTVGMAYSYDAFQNSVDILFISYGLPTDMMNAQLTAEMESEVKRVWMEQEYDSEDDVENMRIFLFENDGLLFETDIIKVGKVNMLTRKYLEE